MIAVGLRSVHPKYYVNIGTDLGLMRNFRICNDLSFDCAIRRRPVS